MCVFLSTLLYLAIVGAVGYVLVEGLSRLLDWALNIEEGLL